MAPVLPVKSPHRASRRHRREAQPCRWDRARPLGRRSSAEPCAGFGVEEPERARRDGDLCAVLLRRSSATRRAKRPTNDVRRAARRWSSSRQRGRVDVPAISRTASVTTGAASTSKCTTSLRAQQLAQLHEPLEAPTGGRARRRAPRPRDAPGGRRRSPLAVAARRAPAASVRSARRPRAAARRRT